MKKKVIGLLIVLAVLIGAALYASWARTPVLELFPEGQWEKVTYERFWEAIEREVPREQFREILEGQHVWYGGRLKFLPEYIFFISIDGEYWQLGVSDGYTSLMPPDPDPESVLQYRDDGTIYRLVEAFILSQ